MPEWRVVLDIPYVRLSSHAPYAAENGATQRNCTASSTYQSRGDGDMFAVEVVRPPATKSGTGKARKLECRIVTEQGQEVARVIGGASEEEELRLAQAMAAAPALWDACRIALQALQAGSYPALAQVKGVLETALTVAETPVRDKK